MSPVPFFVSSQPPILVRQIEGVPLTDKHPTIVKEIKTVIRDLVQGSPEKQQNALYSNFTEDASFTHPFCHVPSFGNIQIPFLFTINSRWLVLMIYRWYRILSPNIEMEIESSGMFYCLASYLTAEKLSGELWYRRVKTC